MKRFGYLLLVLVSAILMPNIARSTHVVGGSITYEHLGGATYRVTMKMYKDCDPSSINFPATLNIDVYTGATGAYHSTISIPRPPQDTLDPFVDTCAFNPGVCVSQAVYTTVVNNLPPGTGGYHLVYQLCCRNGSVTNLTNPLNVATSYHAFIPDNNQVLTNSSPDWVNFPPVFICANQPLVFDHSATDPDGDSLAYNLYHPFDDGAFTFTGNQANFPLVPYNAGYNHLSPMEPSAPAQTTFIDPNTGILTTTPPMTGQFVVGVKVEEWRNGQLLSTVYRDFQFNVLNCPPPATAGIGPVDACSGTTIQMNNASSPTAQDFFWDFDDAGATATGFEPTHTFTGIGSYDLMLIAQYGTACADTAYRTIDISWTDADFTTIDSTCVNDPVQFNDGTTTAANGNPDQWFWDFGDGSTSTLPNPTHTYTTGGDYTVQLIAESDVGCIDTISYPLYIQGLPTAIAGPDTTACINNPVVNLNGIVNNADGGLWIGQGGTFTPGASSLTSDYLPDTTEVNSGQSMLILSTTGNGFCPAETDTVIITYVPGPTVDAGPDQSVCQDTASVPLSGSVQIAGGGQWTTSGTGTFSPTDDDLNASYIPTPADTTAGSVWIYLTTTQNGNCIASQDSMLITFFDPPTVSIISADTTCTGDAIVLDGNTSTNAGVWTTLGSGTFTPNDSTVQGGYVPSAADESAGQVTLIFSSLNNGGCQQVRDTVTVTIIPAPTPSFSFTEVCLGDQTAFTDASTAVGSVVSWNWDFGDGNTSTQQNPSHTFTTEGPQNVTLIVESSNGCPDTLVQPVDVHYLPDVGFYNSTPCLNGGSQFIDTTNVSDTTAVSWEWSFGDGNSDTVQDPLHVYGSSGSYNVTLVVTTAYGCVDSASANTTVLPGPDADWIADEWAVNMFENVNFTDQSFPGPNIETWFWDFGDSTGTSTNQDPNYSWDQSGTYPVMLVVVDSNGCADTLIQDVVVFMPPKVPSGFSPNGDGNNDFLFVYGGPYKELDFKVYNNWGELIFSTTDETIGWDGTYKNVPQPMGVYVWTVRAVTEDDVVHEDNGDVTLIR